MLPPPPPQPPHRNTAGPPHRRRCRRCCHQWLSSSHGRHRCRHPAAIFVVAVVVPQLSSPSRSCLHLHRLVAIFIVPQSWASLPSSSRCSLRRRRRRPMAVFIVTAVIPWPSSSSPSSCSCLRRPVAISVVQPSSSVSIVAIVVPQQSSSSHPAVIVADRSRGRVPVVVTRLSLLLLSLPPRSSFVTVA
jgi:hypothetical protein